MLLRCKCPGCGAPKEYIAEEVGTTADCPRCGNRFTLQPNPGRAIWQIVAATLGLLILVGGTTARIYKRAWWSQVRHEQFHKTAENRRTVIVDDDRDD